MPTIPRLTRLRALVVVSEGPKLIRREEKVVIVFRHPPKGDLMEEFECWAIHHFAHVMEEGNEEDVFTSSSDGASNHSGGVGVAQLNPNITQNPTQHNPEDAQTNEAVPTEVVQLFESHSSTLDSDEKYLEHESLQQTVNICSTNAIHAKNGMYLLPVLPRSLLVCRMFWLSSCMYRKQSFNTRLNSVAQNRKK